MTGLAAMATVMAICGGFAYGLWLLADELVPAPPALGAALKRLHQPVVAEVVTVPAAPGGGRLGGWLRDRYGASSLIPHQNLRLLGRSVESYLVAKVATPLLALVAPTVFCAVLMVAGVRVPWAVPPLAGVVLAVLFFFVVDLDIKGKAEKAHGEALHYIAGYLDLVALNRAASLGPVDSLERAAAVSDNWVFARIRDRLLLAQLNMEAPWAGLRRLGDEIGVRELGEVGEIMQLAGEEGGQVYETLRARARSVRAAILAADENSANNATTKLYIALPAYVFVLFAVLGYPYLARAWFT